MNQDIKTLSRTLVGMSAEITPYKTIIFDLDGTIIDSSNEIIDALKVTLADSGLEDIIIDPSNIGLSVSKIISFSNPNVTDEELSGIEKGFRKNYDSRIHSLTSVYSGVIEVLHKLGNRGYQLGLATMKPTKPTIGVLEQLDLIKYFHFVRSSDHWEGERFNKQTLLGRIVTESGIVPSETLYVGDHPNDIIGARNVGFDSVAVSYGYTALPKLKAENPTYLVNEIQELLFVLGE